MSKAFSIEVNDKIKVKKLGYGTVIEVDYNKWKRFNINGKSMSFQGLAKVSFTSPRMEADFSLGWLMDNCEIVGKGRNDDSVSGNKQITGGRVPRDKRTADSIKKAMEKFQSFSMTPASLQEIENLFWFKINYAKGHKRLLRYNLLVQCDESDDELRFLQSMESCFNELDLLPKFANVTRMTSVLGRIYDDEEADDYIRKFSLLALYGFSNSESGRSLESWLKLKKLNERNPECVFIVTGSEGFMDFVKDNEDIFSGFFNHRIHLEESKTLSPVDVKLEVLHCLEEEKLKPSKKFIEEIEKYIESVYPTTELKGKEFVDNLLNNVLVNYYTKPTNNRTVTERCVPFYVTSKSYENIAIKLNELVGLKKVKEKFEELHTLSIDKEDRDKMQLHFAFMGNPGTGKTTVANLTAELLYSKGLVRKNKIVIATQTDIISEDIGESAQHMWEKIEEAKGGVLFIDEAYFLISKPRESGPQKESLDALMDAMERYAGDLTVIFAGNEKEINELLNSNPGLDSRIFYRFVFEDYTEEELMQIFLNLVKEKKLTLVEDTHDTLLKRISMAMYEGSAGNDGSRAYFGNARSMANLFQQVNAVRLKKKKDQNIITKEDILATMPVSQTEDIDQMIGMDTIKEELIAFEARVKYIKYLRDKNMSVPAPNLHMLFLGNPGTGKTTVAKRIADCLYQIGVLKSNNLVVAERKDLIAEYIGHTAPKTQKVIEKALNGVLFIDEAYSLVPEDSGNDFGAEAIATLITAMEDHKDSLVIIFAGYRKEMNRFLQSNPGISSRIGFKFVFPDYSTEELTEMFKRKLESSGFAVADEALEEVKKLMEYFSEIENFGNGRFVDRIIDSTISKRSLRTYGNKFNDIEKIDIPEIKDVARVLTEAFGIMPRTETSDTHKKRIAVHEIGHAIVSLTLHPERKIDSVSVDENAYSAGRVSITGYGDDAYTESFMKGELAILFGGRNAERIVFGEHSAGCRSDMASAKRIAKKMVLEFAVGEFGVTSSTDLLKEADKAATEVLLKYKDSILVIAEQILAEGSVTGEDFEKMLQNTDATKH